jgi:uncharacterized membrane protein YqjE
MNAARSRAARPGTPRSFLGRIISLALVRAELFGIELDEYKDTLLGHLLVGVVAFAALMVALLSGLLLIAVMTPAASRPLVLGLITLCAFFIMALALLALRRRLCQRRPTFALTLREVRKDCQTLLKTGDTRDDPA